MCGVSLLLSLCTYVHTYAPSGALLGQTYTRTEISSNESLGISQDLCAVSLLVIPKVRNETQFSPLCIEFFVPGNGISWLLWGQVNCAIDDACFLLLLLSAVNVSLQLAYSPEDPGNPESEAFPS